MYNIENCPNHIQCKDCKYYIANAELDNVTSQCKRIDHKKIQFAVPWFKSYDCNYHTICCDFKPKHPEYVDFKEWTTAEDFMDIWHKANGYKKNWRETDSTVEFIINGDKNVRYSVKFIDYFYGKMFDDNKLKAISKTYYKQTREGFGYKLITEDIDGVVII